jgi:hypothetical protein
MFFSVSINTINYGFVFIFIFIIYMIVQIIITSNELKKNRRKEISCKFTF